MIYRAQLCHLCGLSSCMHPRPPVAELLVDMAKGPDTQAAEWVTLPDIRVVPIKKIWELGAGYLKKSIGSVALFQSAEVKIEGKRIEATIRDLRITEPTFVRWLHESFYRATDALLPIGPGHFALEIFGTKKTPALSFQLEKTYVIRFEDLQQTAKAAVVRELVLVPFLIIGPPGWNP